MSKNERQERMYNNFTALKALEEIDEEKAVQVISVPDLDGQELSDILECGLLGKIVNKVSGQPLKLSNKVMMAGLRNKLNQVIRDSENKENGIS